MASELDHHGARNSVPHIQRHYMNKSYVLPMGTVEQIIVKSSTTLSLQDDAFENIACEIAPILSWDKYIKQK